MNELPEKCRDILHFGKVKAQAISLPSVHSMP